jgi:hypothetical protein
MQDTRSRRFPLGGEHHPAYTSGEKSMARCFFASAVLMRSAVALGTSAVACGSCAHMPSVRSSFTDNALNRAAFEMSCPKEQLSLVPLNRPLDEDISLGAQVGVTGCGHRMVYVMSMGAGWVANTSSSDADASAGPAAVH